MSAYIEVEQQRTWWMSLIMRLLKLVGVAILLLTLYAIGSRVYGGITSSVTDNEQAMPAWVQSGIEVQQCPVNERVTVIQLGVGIWRIDCIED